MNEGLPTTTAIHFVTAINHYCKQRIFLPLLCLLVKFTFAFFFRTSFWCLRGELTYWGDVIFHCLYCLTDPPCLYKQKRNVGLSVMNGIGFDNVSYFDRSTSSPTGLRDLTRMESYARISR